MDYFAAARFLTIFRDGTGDGIVHFFCSHLNDQSNATASKAVHRKKVVDDGVGMMPRLANTGQTKHQNLQTRFPAGFFCLLSRWGQEERTARTSASSLLLQNLLRQRVHGQRCWPSALLTVS